MKEREKKPSISQSLVFLTQCFYFYDRHEAVTVSVKVKEDKHGLTSDGVYAVIAVHQQQQRKREGRDGSLLLLLDLCGSPSMSQLVISLGTKLLSDVYNNENVTRRTCNNTKDLFYFMYMANVISVAGLSC